MRIDKGGISTFQFMFSIACFILASSLLTAFITSITKQDSWIVVIFGFLVGLLFIWIYMALMKNFPNKNLVEINDLVYGPMVGKIFSCIYVYFFLTLSSLNLKDLGDFIGAAIMPDTPTIVILISFMYICAWAVKSGIQVVTRYSMFFTLIALSIIIITIFLTLNHMDFNNFLPIFRQPTVKYVQGTHIITVIPFGELVVFLMITPNIKIPNKGIKKYFILGFLIGGIGMILVVLRDIAVLGNTITLFSLPSFETLRLTSVSATLSRMEVLFAVILIILYFFKICFLYYVTVLAISQIFKLDSYKNLVIGVGVIIIIYSFNVYSSIIQHIEYGSNITPFQWLIYEFLLPLITLIVAKIRKLPEELPLSQEEN
ncbi:endospore germination permease [Irregularibacter muris]|uniref:Endospore germination permease n=1 Tax=Irregularibacter muris TaxID=1796619 RepID=A0AAE3KZ18_9FIRM|nr:endospore germination permease [Irregularibacter muris]MCR1897512.1 endospore germination permease [Irregularibacter muris]